MYGCTDCRCSCSGLTSSVGVCEADEMSTIVSLDWSGVEWPGTRQAVCVMNIIDTTLDLIGGATVR